MDLILFLKIHYLSINSDRIKFVRCNLPKSDSQHSTHNSPYFHDLLPQFISYAQLQR